MLIGGNSLVGVITPLRARIEGFPDLTVGLLGSVYFAGMLAGTLAAPAIIRRGGHIRAYTAFVSLAVVSVILMPVMVSQWAWLGCRALIGFVFAGLYAVIEAWINAKATNSNRGALYALYQIANFVASASGQLALKPLGVSGFSPFAVAGALLALAIVPMAMTSVDPPAQPRSVRPPPPLAHSHGADSVFRRAGRGRRERRLSRSDPFTPSGSAWRRDSAPLFTSVRRPGLRARRLCRSPRSPTAIDRRLVIAAVMIAGAARSKRALSRMACARSVRLLDARLSGRPDDLLGLYALAVSHRQRSWRLRTDLVFISVGSFCSSTASPRSPPRRSPRC